jgi:hypothetical protein
LQDVKIGENWTKGIKEMSLTTVSDVTMIDYKMSHGKKKRDSH